MQAMQMPRPAGVEELLVVVQVEAVEIRTLPAAGLGNAENLSASQFQRLASAGLDRELPDQLSI